MKITALYKLIGDVSILAICTKDDWQKCAEHNDCYPAAVSMNNVEITNADFISLDAVHMTTDKNIHAKSLKTGDTY
jgi:hypothetical protein